ncbi:MAG: GNAT family N-acetyltransferase, partial [Gammaproteobacteria bacterium]|nr:GNAT family N-acetyltransferase [Gammaproteobacteria bacterium]
MTLTWHTKPFDALSNSELYSMLRLRSEVFVVEQDCVYLDLDNIDQKAHHVIAINAEREVVCCARIV